VITLTRFRAAQRKTSSVFADVCTRFFSGKRQIQSEAVSSQMPMPEFTLSGYLHKYRVHLDAMPNYMYMKEVIHS